MFEIDSTLISSWLGSVMLPFFRISAMFLSAPIFGAQLILARTRLAIAFLMTMVLAPNLPEMPVIDALSVTTMVLVAQQLLIGIAMGLVMQLLLQLFIVGGEIIAMHMALSFASMVDPVNGVTVTVLSQLHLMLVTLLFISLNGHLAMIEVLTESFYALPVGAGFISDEMLWTLAGRATWMFSSAMLLALPAIASLMVINYSLGIVTRAAPQLNIFALGFPVMLIIGLCIIWVTMDSYIPLFDRFTHEALDMMAFLVTP